MNPLNVSLKEEWILVSDLKKAVNTKNIQPNDNFYSYINDRWISEYELTESQKYIVQVDDFRIVQDKVYRELAQILDLIRSKRGEFALSNKYFVEYLNGRFRKK